MPKVNELLDALEEITVDPGDLTRILQHIAQTAKIFFCADSCVIFAINPITNRFIGSLTVAGNLQKRDSLSYKQPRPEGIAPQVLRQGILLVEDLEAIPDYHSIFTRTEGIHSFAALALQLRNRQKPLGVLYLNFKQKRQFNSADHELFQIFADRASFILQETWLLRRYQAVAHIGEEINNELATVDILFQKLRKHLVDILDINYALLLAVYQPQTNTLDLYLEEEGHFILRENDPLEGACQYVIETQQTVFIREMSKEAAHLPFRPIEIITGKDPKESLIFVPLVLRDIPLGILSIQHSKPNAYDQEDQFILELLANHIALALNNIRLFASLSRLNETGQLLTQQLESKQTLQVTVDKIREATKADVVVLYPYEPTHQRFVLPPRIAGTLHSSPPQFMSPNRPNDIVSVALHHVEPIFAKQSASIYTILQGDVRIRQESFQQREEIRSTAIVPLKVGEESVGVLFVNFRQPQYFDAPQKKLIDGLAHYAAIAIKNAQEYGSLIQRRLHELEILQHIDRELSRTLDLGSLLNTLLKLAREQVPAEDACILLYNSHIQELEILVALGPHAEARRKLILPSQETRGITRWVLEHKKSVRVDNVHSDPQWRNLYLPSIVETISELDVPLLDGEEVVGVLNFESTRQAAFRQEDEHFLLTLAGQAVLAIKNAQAYEREKRLAEEGRVLNEISKEITSQLDLVRVFDLILEKALELTHSTTGNLMLYDPDQNNLWMAAERGVAVDKKGQRQALDQGVVGYVASTKKLLNVDLSQPPWHEVNLDFIPGTRSELAVAMLAGNDVLGVLNIESLSANNFSESDERLLKGLADLAVVALQNAQAYEREKRLVAEGQVLNEISKEIISQLDPVHVFDLILEKALELTQSHMGNLMLYDPDQGDLWMAAERGMDKDKKRQRQGLDQGVVGYVASTKKLLNVDLSQSPWNEIYLEFFPGAHSELAVPMLAGNDVHGVLNVESPTRNNFSESDERLLKGLADLAVVALQNAQAYEREKRLVEEGQVLNEISKEIISQLDPIHVFDLILEKALELTHSMLGALLLYDPNRNDLWIAAERGVIEQKKGRRVSLDQGIVGYVARNKQLLMVDPSQEPWNEIYRAFIPGARSELTVPMLAGNEIRGVLNIESPTPNNFSERDVRLMKGLADLAVVALQNAERYQQAEREAQRFKLLYQAGQELSKITDLVQLEQAYDAILQIAEDYSQSQVVIRRYDENNQELVMIRTSKSQYSSFFGRKNLDVGINGQVARERRTIVISNTNNPPPEVVSAHLSDPTTRSLLITPIMFKDQYYGNLGLRHKEVGYFRKTDVIFFEGLAQQLASTIYRLETARERQEFEQRAISAETMSSIGQIAFELTHRWGNDLGLVRSYVNDIRSELKTLNVTSTFISEKLENIVRAAGAVLNLSKELKQALVRTGEAIVSKPVVIEPGILLEEAQDATSLPSNIEICLEIDNDVAAVRVIHSLVVDILRNLMTNAIDAMPEGGKITLKAHNAGRFVALEVIDTGAGIPQQSLSKIFDLFYSTKGSSGFGLWSARTNALRNQGDLTVKSQEGQSTTFTLLVPRAEK